MKKIFLFLGLLIINCGILFAEEITITTYYPSPYGSYNFLQTDKLGVGDNNGDGSFTAADVPVTSGDVWINGKVGINTGTANPMGKLHIYDPGLGNLYFMESPWVTGEMMFDGGADGDFGFSNTGIAAGRTQFRWYNGTTSVDNLVILNNGNVGIGTVSPTAKLDVRGEIFVTDGTNSVTLAGNDLKFDRNARAYISNINGGAQSALAFTTKGGSGNERMFITALGDVGIGTVAPSHQLDVRGSIGNGGSLWHASDIRWKKDINTITYALDKVLKLRGVVYKWKKEEYPEMNFESGKHLGLIAQEVEKVIPEVVSANKEGYKSVEYSNLVAVLVEAIKEQNKENVALKDRINKLEKKLDALGKK